MPKLKSVIAGLALSTAVTGGALVTGATLTATSANAATQISAGTSVLSGGHFCGRRCHRHHRKHIKVVVENFNFNRNPRFEHRRDFRNNRHHHRFFHHRNFDNFDNGDWDDDDWGND